MNWAKLWGYLGLALIVGGAIAFAWSWLASPNNILNALGGRMTLDDLGWFELVGFLCVGLAIFIKVTDFPEKVIGEESK